jgi:hypothetical protein
MFVPTHKAIVDSKMHMLHIVVMVEEIWWRESVAHVIKLIWFNQINMSKPINDNFIIVNLKR